MMFKIGSFNQKQTIALSAIILGVILMVFASYGLREAVKADSAFDKFTGFFTNAAGFWNPVITFFGGVAHEEATVHNPTLRILLVVGAAMVASGIWGVLHYKERQ